MPVRPCGFAGKVRTGFTCHLRRKVEVQALDGGEISTPEPFTSPAVAPVVPWCGRGLDLLVVPLEHTHHGDLTRPLLAGLLKGICRIPRTMSRGEPYVLPCR